MGFMVECFYQETILFGLKTEDKLLMFLDILTLLRNLFDHQEFLKLHIFLHGVS